MGFRTCGGRDQMVKSGWLPKIHKPLRLGEQLFSDIKEGNELHQYLKTWFFLSTLLFFYIFWTNLLRIFSFLLEWEELIKVSESCAECCVSLFRFGSLFCRIMPDSTSSHFDFRPRTPPAPTPCGWVMLLRKWGSSPGKWLSLKSNRNRGPLHFQRKNRALSLHNPVSHK